jgi:hypothetical protein
VGGGGDRDLRSGPGRTRERGRCGRRRPSGATGGVLPDFDFTDPGALKKYYRGLLKYVKKLEGSAPSEIKGALKHLIPVYEKIAADPATNSKLVAKPEVRKNLAKVGKYLTKNCKLRVPST